MTHGPKAARDALCEVFETELDIWLVSSGTAANALALSAPLPLAWRNALPRRGAYRARRTRRAEFFTRQAASLSLLPGAHARIDLAALKQRLAANDPSFIHETPLHALSLSNLTECGAAYRPFEIAERAASRAKPDLPCISMAPASPTPSSQLAQSLPK